MAETTIDQPKAAVTSSLREHYVYALMRPDNGAPFYIGKGNRRRRFWYIENARNRVRRGRHTRKDDAIVFFLDAKLEIPIILIRSGLTNDEAVETEVALIAALGRWPNGPLLNRTSGGGGLRDFKHKAATRLKIGNANRGLKRSPEQLARVSASQTGKKLTEEHKAKVSAGLKGRIKPPEECKNISLGLKGKPKSPEHVAKIRGAKHSDQTKAKMRAAWERRKLAGRGTTRGTKGMFYINDGKIDRLIPNGGLIPAGWTKGKFKGDGRFAVSDEERARRSARAIGRKRGPYRKRNPIDGKQTSLLESAD